MATQSMPCGHPDGPDSRINNGRCRLCNREEQARYREANREKVAAQKARWLNEVRTAALTRYGLECACCGESVKRFLTLDHVNNDGAEHRKSASIKNSSQLYTWLKRNDYPDGFQTLCSSCNMGRHINGGDCPHRAPFKEPTTTRQRYTLRLKSEVMSAYGGKCSCCDESTLTFLTIDHVEGGGNSDRRAVSNGHSGGSGKFYNQLKREGWPEGFQVLCFNCNDAKHWNGGVCPHRE